MKTEHKHMNLFLLGATTIWGIKPASMKIGLKYMPPQDYNVIRLIVAAGAA